MNEAGLKTILTYAIILPLAIFLGYTLASPTSFGSFAVMVLCLMVVSIPLWIKQHHMALIVTWNMALVVPLLPGQPALGIFVAVISFGITIVTVALRRNDEFIHVPSIAWPLGLLAVVVLVTSFLTGGIGARALGSESFGGKRYLQLFGAIIGYFALVGKSVPRHRAQLAAGLFLLSGVTVIGSDLVYLAGPSFYFLFVVFPTNMAALLATTQDVLSRSAGIAWSTLAIYCFMLVRYGIRGVMDLSRPWRFLVFAAAIGAGLLGGFRGSIVLIVLIFAAQFYFEGLFRTRYFAIMLALCAVLGAATATFIDKMPLAVQRSLSFLPLDVDPLARQDAVSTLDWRLQMWKVVVKEVPDYLILGKGFGFSGADFYLTQEAIRRGLAEAYDDTLVTGNYHNGILTVLIPFGIFGLLFFLWFCVSAWLVLYRNYKYGDAELKNINTFFLAYFSAKLAFYFGLYGQLDLDLAFFTGVVGLSIALNRGVCRQYIPEFKHERIVRESDEEAIATQPV